MAHKLGLGPEPQRINFGSSFYSKQPSQYHTIRYDFKPASVDSVKESQLTVGEGGQVTVKVPHVPGAPVTQTVFKGSRKPYNKECVLIVDHKTGQITLERLGYNIQLKKTRSENNRKTAPSIRPPVEKKPSSQPSRDKKPPPADAPGMSRRFTQPVRPITPVDKKLANSHNKVNNGPPMGRLPNKKPVTAQAPTAPLMPGSMPLLGVEKAPQPSSASPGDLSDSSSSDAQRGDEMSSSSSAASSSSDSDSDTPAKSKNNNLPSVSVSKSNSGSLQQNLYQDLQLSSESDSD